MKMFYFLRFYHSILDDADNIQYNNSKISQTIASISTSLSYSLYKFITNTNYTGSKQANTSYVCIHDDIYIYVM